MSNAFAARQWATMKLFEGVSRHKGKVLISLVITTLAMSLLLVAFTLSLTAYNSVKGVSVAQEMTIFTNQGVSSERAANLKETIEKQPGITRVRLVSPDEALGLIGDTDNTDLSFSTNPLPNILLATVSTDIPEKQVDETAKFIEKQPGVDSVAYDSTWNSNIQALKNAFTKFGLLTGGLLCGLILMVLLGSASLAATTPLKEALRLNSMGAPTSSARMLGGLDLSSCSRLSPPLLLRISRSPASPLRSPRLSGCTICPLRSSLCRSPGRLLSLWCHSSWETFSED
jgi:hypothetical protein